MSQEKPMNPLISPELGELIKQTPGVESNSLNARMQTPTCPEPSKPTAACSKFKAKMPSLNPTPACARCGRK